MFGSTPARPRRARRPRSMWSGTVFAKYWALQLPATALVIIVALAIGESLAWPRWVVWTIVAAWVAKDAILFPLVWRSYDPEDPAALPYPVECQDGVALTPIDPSGLVRVWGELWRAELSPGAPPIAQDAAVRVNDRHGLTLLVEPAGDAAGAATDASPRSTAGPA